MKSRSSGFHSGTAISLSMFLRLPRRICHASPAVRGYCIGRRWRGCHNSTASYRTCAAGFPPSLWEAVRKYHCSPIQVKAFQKPFWITRDNVGRSDSLSYFPPFASCRPRAAPYSAAVWFSYPQYRMFNFQGSERYGEKSPFTPQRTFFHQMSTIAPKFFCLASDGRNAPMYVLTRKAKFPGVLRIVFARKDAVLINIQLAGGKFRQETFH